MASGDGAASSSGTAPRGGTLRDHEARNELVTTLYFVTRHVTKAGGYEADQACNEEPTTLVTKCLRGMRHVTRHVTSIADHEMRARCGRDAGEMFVFCMLLLAPTASSTLRGHAMLRMHSYHVHTKG